MTINWVCIRVRISIRHKISVKSEAPPVETAESCCGGIAPAGAPDAVRYTFMTGSRFLTLDNSPWPFDRPLKSRLTAWPSSSHRLCLHDREWTLLSLAHAYTRCSDAQCKTRWDFTGEKFFLCNKNGCELIIVVTVQPFFAICGKLSPSPTELSCKTSLHLCQTSTPSYVVDLRVALRLSLKKDFSITNCGGFPWKQTSSGS